MKYLLPTVTVLLGASALGSVAAQKAEHPNIIYVFPDQFRNCAMNFWSEPGFRSWVNFQADPVHTPNLDKFARQSVVLTSAQSNCPLSSPHRGMLLTGMYPDKNGVTLNCNDTRPISSLRKDVTAISDVFNQNGYDCAYFGKLHVDFPTPNNPQKPGTYVEEKRPVWDAYTPVERRHGFRVWYSYGTFDEHKRPHYWDTQGERHEIREWSPKHEADKVIEFLKIDRDPNKPFFVMVSMNPPHSPYRSLEDCEEKDYDLYKDVPLNKLLIRPNVNTLLKSKQENAPYYFASVSGVDREFGRILDALKSMNLDKNTIVVFSSDHGETMASHVEDPKNSPYVESMNVPFLIRYPEKLKPTVSKLLLSTPDVMPTLLSLAGLKEQIPVGVQGKDLSAQLIHKTTKGSPEGVLYIRNTDGAKDAQGKVLDYFPEARGIKTARYTLSITINRQKKVKQILIFDDLNDPYQIHPLSADKNKELIHSLCKQMSRFLKKADDAWYRDKILLEYFQY